MALALIEVGEDGANSECHCGSGYDAHGKDPVMRRGALGSNGSLATTKLQFQSSSSLAPHRRRLSIPPRIRPAPRECLSSK
jgi:hypothetical protein